MDSPLTKIKLLGNIGTNGKNYVFRIRNVMHYAPDTKTFIRRS